MDYFKFSLLLLLKQCSNCYRLVADHCSHSAPREGPRQVSVITCEQVVLSLNYKRQN